MMKSRFLQGVSAAALALALTAPAFAPAFAQSTTGMPATSGSTASGATGGAPAATSTPMGARVGGNPGATTAPAQMTGTGPMTGGTAPAPGTQNGKMEARVDQRITQLHKRLRITAAQETQWNAFAGVMRTNAQQMDQLWQQQMGNMTDMTAPQSMQAYAALAQAHAQQVQQLVPAFQTLYNGFSPEQKKIADKAFSPRQVRARAARARARHGAKGAEGTDAPSNG